MGQLAGFRYREIIKRLKKLGFEFVRQAAGSHEIWFNPTTNRYTTIPNHPGDMPEGTLSAILNRPRSMWKLFWKNSRRYAAVAAGASRGTAIMPSPCELLPSETTGTSQTGPIAI